jgi:DNA-binding NarL/FixJ family response regulator
MKVLLVEAEHGVRDRFKVALQQFEGFTVDTAEDSWALELAKETAYDMVAIADQLKEPGDGIQLLRDLRASGVIGPAIVLTRDGGAAIAQEKEMLNVASILPVPPETVDCFKSIVTAQNRLFGKPSR